MPSPTYRPGDRVVLTDAARAGIIAKHGAAQERYTHGVGVVTTNPFAELYPQSMLDYMVTALNTGEIFVRWEFDPDTPCPMMASAVLPWAPSGEKHTTGRFAVGDTVLVASSFCECSKCDFTAGCILTLDPTGVTAANDPGPWDYMVQWDTGMISFNNDAELARVGERYSEEP